MQTIAPFPTLTSGGKRKKNCTEILTAVPTMFESVACMDEPRAIWAVRFWMGASYVCDSPIISKHWIKTPQKTEGKGSFEKSEILFKLITHQPYSIPVSQFQVNAVQDALILQPLCIKHSREPATFGSLLHRWNTGKTGWSACGITEMRHWNHRYEHARA